jgi:hypothetical protein
MLDSALEAINEWELIGMLVGVAVIGFPVMVIVLQWLNRGAPMFERREAEDGPRLGRKWLCVLRRQQR